MKKVTLKTLPNGSPFIFGGANFIKSYDDALSIGDLGIEALTECTVGEDNDRVVVYILDAALVQVTQ